ncbi:MAG: PH domain-containing protein [Deltaproteobacteria bacterium]|nr:PH domain-containing protein [Deltaproteobacteria bacterium]
MSADDIEIETIPGLPGDLPPGERVLWQGRPSWRALARQTFSLRWLAGYFGLFVSLRAAVALEERTGIAIVLDVLSAAGLAAACLGLFTLIAWLHARFTIYTITTRRIVMRIGVALPMTWNLPFKRLAAADLSVRATGDGDIVLRLVAPDRIAWLHLWPHVAPWKIVRAEPALRAIPDPARVAGILSAAVSEWASANEAPVQLGAEIAPFTPSLGIGAGTPRPAEGAGFAGDLATAEAGR